MLRKTLTTTAFCGAILASGLWAMGDPLDLTGTVRDFKRGDQTGGHPDFETAQTVAGHGQYGLVYGLVGSALNSSGKPVYNPTRPSNDTMSGANNFNQWFNDVPGVNISMPLTLTLSNGQSNPGGVYTYSSNAFFPIDKQGFGNQNQKDGSGTVRNFSFTFELHTKFNYRPGQNFTFIGDDDVWVYVNNAKVIDLGGVHSAQTGTVLLFNGKAFVANAAFPVGGVVQSVTTSMAASLAEKWSALGLSGNCPIVSGSRYINLNLGGGFADMVANYQNNNTQVNIKCVEAIISLVLKFTDGTTQYVPVNNVTNGTWNGTGAYAGKPLAGVWVKSVSNTAATNPGLYLGADGSGGIEAALDFFFAERHVTNSNFRIDTSMNLKPKPLATLSPLYD